MNKFQKVLNAFAEVIRIIGSVVAILAIMVISIAETGLSGTDMLLLITGSLIFCGFCFAIAWLISND